MKQAWDLKHLEEKSCLQNFALQVFSDALKLQAFYSRLSSAPEERDFLILAKDYRSS